MQKKHVNLRRGWFQKVSLAVAFVCGVLVPTAGFSQSLDDTVQFISDMANTHGFVQFFIDFA